MTVTPLLQAQAVCLRRGVKPVLHEVDLALRAGEACALVGPNAAGKTTLVRVLAGLLRPSSGQVLLRGRPLLEWPRDALARTVALVTTEEMGADSMSVEERAALGRYPHRGALRPFRAEDRSAVSLALRRTGIEDLAHRTLGTLSAGERQLAALARGLAQEPELLLLDEPAAHLDIGHELRLFRVLDEVRASGVAVLAVAHDLQRAAAWAERMVLLAGGRVVADGPPDRVLEERASQAFGVVVRGHAVSGLRRRLFSFEEV